MTDRMRETLTTFDVSPKMVHNDRGETVEVLLSYDMYQAFLRILADYVDWEMLPPYLQDEVDGMLADEAKREPGESIPLRDALRATGDLS